ncbi:hypothetical protein HRI_002237600 [Hibiscus trionum]|uniref:Uncharacterized protein n=1 Tax=Hibiscus trionum TaxID=183268 RepID=A0A9W7M2T5_HIBTR|nr:hypothetical protein HRI_002237600 [Hibiscus trionum]
MLAILLKLVFSIVSTLANLVTWSIFTATAYCVVLLINAFKVPGEALHVALEKLAEAIRTCLEYFLDLVVELTGSLISSGFKLLIDTVTSSASSSGAAFGELVEKTRTSLQELLTDLPEIAEGFSEMVSTVVRDLWKNCMEAMGYVTGNA